MRALLAVVLLLDLYAVVYYRLLVKHYYEKTSGVRESGFAVVFSLPPYSALPEKGRIYARRYWIAVAVMLGCIGLVAWSTDFDVFRQAWQIGQ